MNKIIKIVHILPACCKCRYFRAAPSIKLISSLIKNTEMFFLDLSVTLSSQQINSCSENKTNREHEKNSNKHENI